MKVAGSFLNDVPHGKKIALFCESKEKMLFSGSYEKGFKKYGKLFYHNGVLLYNGSFNFDEPCGNNIKLYHSNGHIMFIGDFKNGVPYNKGMYFNEAEKLMWNLRIENGLKICEVYETRNQDKKSVSAGEEDDGEYSQDQEKQLLMILTGLEADEFLSNFKFYDTRNYSF